MSGLRSSVIATSTYTRPWKHCTPDLNLTRETDPETEIHVILCYELCQHDIAYISGTKQEIGELFI
jgi:hypothetical protein